MNTKQINPTRKPGRPSLFNEPTKDIPVRLPISLVEKLKESGEPLSKTIREILESHYAPKT